MITTNHKPQTTNLIWLVSLSVALVFLLQFTGCTPDEPAPLSVTFNSKGGSTVEAIKVKNGGKATKPTDPTQAGNRFEGWYTDDKYTTAFDFTTPITANITLYAKWTRVYNFTFAKGTVRSDIVSYDISVKVDGKDFKTETNYATNTYSFVKTDAITDASQIEVSIKAKKAGGIVVGNGSVSLVGSATDAKTITLATVGGKVKGIVDWSSVYNNGSLSASSKESWPARFSILARASILASYESFYYKDFRNSTITDFTDMNITSFAFEVTIDETTSNSILIGKTFNLQAQLPNNVSLKAYFSNTVTVSWIEGETAEAGTMYISN